jgi:hypothetical protein
VVELYCKVTIGDNPRRVGPLDPAALLGAFETVELGLYPIVTFQYSSTTLYQVSYHIQYLVL